MTINEFNAKILQLDCRINLMRSRDESMNQRLINALIREKRNLEQKRDLLFSHNI